MTNISSISVLIYTDIYIYIERERDKYLGGALSKMVITIGNGHGDLSSNSR